MKKFKPKSVVTLAVSVILIVCLAALYSFNASAEMVEVYNDKNPTFDFTNINGKCPGGQYEPQGEIVSQQDGVYKFKSNSFIFWYDQDNLSYAHKKCKFNTGNGSVMTITTTVTEWTGNECGITVRESLDPNSAAFMVSFRPVGAFLIYRNMAGQDWPNYTNAERPLTFGKDPLHLRLILEKSTGRVTAQYKLTGSVDEDKGWSTVGTTSISFVKKSLQFYVGMSLVSTDENKTAELTLDGFNINVQAPEGYTEDPIDEPSGGGDDKPEIVLPEDMEAPGDALLYETFTDGDMFPQEKDIKVNNPLWTVRKGSPVLEVDAEKTDRYLSCYPVDDDLFMIAGSESWTDYSVQYDFKFNKDTSLADANDIDLLLRHKDRVIGATYDYHLRMYNQSTGGNKGQYIQIGIRNGSSSYVGSADSVLYTYKILADDMIERDVDHTLKVDVIDVTFNVYLDGKLLFTYTDDCSKHKGSDAILEGNVGLYIKKAYVEIDNIMVRKLFDPLGGDYDNDIKGNYDQPIPDYIRPNYE